MKPSQDTISGDVRTSTKEIVQWVQALMDLHTRIAPHFARPEPRRRALSYLQGVMSEIRRKNSWQLAEHAREATPYGMQRLLASAVWDDALVRDDLLHYVYEHLGTPDGIFVIDETSFPKRGEKSAGVKVQYCGTTGRLENCQVAVFLDYVTVLGHSLIDCELYLPQDWIDDRERCREAGIPESTGFKTKCELARLMIERIYRARIPISWVVADTVYGNNQDLRDFLEDHGSWFVLAVASTETVDIRTPDGRRRRVHVHEVEALLLQTSDWQRLSMGNGTKGPRLYDWVCVPILHKWEDDGCHWLLIRRCIDRSKTKTYYFVFGPPGTTLQVMVKVMGFRWRIEDDFETSKDLGLAQYQVRCFLGWYRHITLVMLAHAFLAVICSQAQKNPVVDANPSPIRVVDASPPAPVPSPPALIPAPKEAPSLAALQAPPLSAPKESSLLPVPQACSLPFGASMREAAFVLPSLINPAPLTIPEVRHLLATLIWPTSANSELMLGWSWWRRCHRGMASYYHTKRRLDAP